MPAVGSRIAILGISCFYHDSAACLIIDGHIVAAAQEERFTRIKHDADFPRNAARYCLSQAGLEPRDLTYVVFYDKPILTFERLLMTHLAVAPKGLRAWLAAMPVWLRKKLHVPRLVRQRLGYEGPVLFTEHHEAHAGSAFFPSPFNEAAILTIDGVGEWATSSFGVGQGNRVALLKELHFPDSLGLLYSAFTYFTGFKVNSGEYKLMGLAPFGVPKYSDLILRELVDLKSDGSLRLNLSYFDFLGGLRMTNRRFARLFDGPPRQPEQAITQREMNIAASIQAVTEKIVMRMAAHVHTQTGQKNLCMAGGVALNCVANGRLLREGPFENIWIQPAAGDAGGALGAAFCVWHRLLKRDRRDPQGRDLMQHAHLGPSYGNGQIRAFLQDGGYPFHPLDNGQRARIIADHIAAGRIVGHFAGRMEYGPRALGARSILGDPRRPDTQQVMNLKIKYRESFRPFAPAVLEERKRDYFDLPHPSPYMLMVAPVVDAHRLPQKNGQVSDLFQRVHERRSDVPAVTHVDYSARIQTVARSDQPDFYAIIKNFEERTGCPMVVNTSFNVRGEPIVCTPQDAYRCFMRTEMDVLVMENCLLLKNEQPSWQEGDHWREILVSD